MRAAKSIAFGVAAVLCLGTAWRLSALLEATRSVVGLPPPALVVIDPARDAVDRADVRPWLRPLFSRPGAQADSSADVTGSTPEKMPKLVGVVTDGGRRMAVIAYNGALLRVDERHKVGAWTVVRVDPHSALLQDEQTSFRLDLDPNAHRD